MSWFNSREIKSSNGITDSKLGSFGSIIFQVSERRIETVSKYSREIKARYTTHEIIGQKPILEYLSADLQEITFTMQFHISLGVNPLREIEKLTNMCESGEVNYLIIGNTVIGENKWVIERVSESEDIWTPDGNLLYSEVNVQLKEYI